MKATIFRKHGGLDRLQFTDFHTPAPRRGEVRVRVHACALNHLDLWVRQGLPGPRIPLPHISGSDIAGIVDKTGPGVRGVRPGERVIITPGIGCDHCPECRAGRDHCCPDYQLMGYQRQGGYAQYTTAPATSLIKISRKLGFVEWAAVPLVFLTAWHMLVTRARVRKGEDLLVHAAGSGIGSAAVQIGRLMGARVITTAGTDAKLKRAKGLGAHEVLNYRRKRFDRAVLALTRGKGADVIFEHIGPQTWPQNLACLARRGRMVFCGSTSGAQTSVNVRALFVKQHSLLGSYMGTRPELTKIMRLVHLGKLKPVVDSVFRLQDAAQAQKKMLDRKQFGKIVLKI